MTPSRDAETDAVVEVLDESRRLGFLGPGSLRVHLDHAHGFAAGSDGPPDRLLDLGSGGGVPGLVLVMHWPHVQAVLLDASARRCAFLEASVARLGCADRVRVVRGRAEEAGRRPDLRAAFDLVVARGFGAPAVTAECGAPFLSPGGTLVVSEPPSEDGAAPGAGAETVRWPADGLARLGLVDAGSWAAPYRYRALVLEGTCPDAYPRRDGVPAKRPLWRA